MGLPEHFISCDWGTTNFRVSSGVKSQAEMMRGEEVQAIGLVEHLKAYKKGILIYREHTANTLLTKTERTQNSPIS